MVYTRIVRSLYSHSTYADPPVPARNLITIKLDIEGAKLQPMRKATKAQQERTTTGYLPYISLAGERKSGPIAYPKRNIVIINEPTELDVVSSSFIVKLMPGAKMEDPSGLSTSR
jgi:hypothetical protein